MHYIIVKCQSQRCCGIRALEKEANCSLGVRMYTRQVDLPRVLITEPSIPTLHVAAAVAAPMRKLCPAKFCSGKPVALIASLTLLVIEDFVSGRPS